MKAYLKSLNKKIEFKSEHKVKIKFSLNCIDNLKKDEQGLPTWGIPKDEFKFLFEHRAPNKLMLETKVYLETLNKFYVDFNLTESFIKEIHNSLFKYSLDPIEIKHKGNYKEAKNQLTLASVEGYKTSEITIKTTEPQLVEREIKYLMGWTNEQLRIKQAHPIIIISIFMYEFLSIHPFKDGNGRTARILMQLLLLKEGYSFVKYRSLERMIEYLKWHYYESLASAQMHRATNKENLSGWITYNFICIGETMKKDAIFKPNYCDALDFT